MSYKHCCVIDKNGYYITFVLVLGDIYGNDAKIQHYQLREGERLIDAPAPAGMARPRWTGTDWQETLPPPDYNPDTHMAHWDDGEWRIEAKPTPQSPPATQDEVLAAYEALTLVYEQNLALQDQSLAVMEAVTEVYELVLLDGGA